jgi:hypothetical protein
MSLLYFETLKIKKMKKLNAQKLENTQGGNAPFFWWVGCVLEVSYYNPGMSLGDAGTICHLSWDNAIQ